MTEFWGSASPATPIRNPMQIILASTLLVALAEIGDKTMLLAIILAARFQRPVPIIAGIFAATIVNHGLAAWAGSEIAGMLDSFWFRLAVGIGFVAMAGWTLVPDKVDEAEGAVTAPHGIAFTEQGDILVSEFNLFGRVHRFNVQHSNVRAKAE